MLELQTLLLLIPEHLYVSSPPLLTISPQLTPCCRRLPNLILMDLFVSLNVVPFALVNFHCLILNFPPTKEVLVLTYCLILSLPGMNKPGLVILFVVVVNTLAADNVAELLGQLRTSDLSVLLIPNQWFVGEKEDSDISKLPFSSFPQFSDGVGKIYIAEKIVFLENVFQAMQTILKCLYGINLLGAFKFIQGRFPPSFFTSRILLRN